MSYALLKIRNRDSEFVRVLRQSVIGIWFQVLHESCRARRVDEFRILKHSIWSSYDEVMPR